MGNENRSKPIAKTHLDMGQGTGQINNEELLRKPNYSEIKKSRKQ